MLDELERKFKSLAVSLQQTEPERAKKLDETLQEARRLLLSERMGKITSLLNQAQLESATGDQKAILADIRQLLELLLDEKSDRDKAREEYERLAEFKRQIENVLAQERGEKREADRLANKDDTLKALQAKIKAVEALIEEQKRVIAETEAARGEGIQALGPLSGKQAAVRKGVEQVVGEMSKEAGDPQPGEGTEPGKTPPADGKPAVGGDAKPVPGSDSKPSPGSDAKPGSDSNAKPSPGSDAKPKPGADAKPAAGSDGKQPSEGSSGQGSSSQGSSSEGSPSEGSQPGSKPARPPEAGEKSLESAIQNQKKAEGNLQQGKGKAAQNDEETALADLERALGELKKESSRIASLPPEAFEKMAGKQDDIANQTAQISEKMKQGSQGGGESGGGQSGGEQGGEQGGEKGGEQGGNKKPTPGQQKVQQAQQSMQKAAGDLRKQDPADASRQEGRAIKDLEEALREIEERLAQLREETQIEKLARLEARFREMLARQQQATADTLSFEKKRQEAGGELKRTDRLAVAKVAALSLAEAAQQSLDIILDDGTSVVFADVVEQVRDDLQAVAKQLDAKETGTYTSTLQKEVETTLEELIEALQEAQKQKKEGSGGGGGGGGGDEPLLPGSAELKLLRSAQLRINRRTVAIDQARSEATALNDVMKQELQGLAQRQAEIGEMTIRILERSAGQ
jgi:hypothetical protein